MVKYAYNSINIFVIIFVNIFYKYILSQSKTTNFICDIHGCFLLVIVKASSHLSENLSTYNSFYM